MTFHGKMYTKAYLLNGLKHYLSIGHLLEKDSHGNCLAVLVNLLAALVRPLASSPVRVLVVSIRPENESVNKHLIDKYNP